MRELTQSDIRRYLDSGFAELRPPRSAIVVGAGAGTLAVLFVLRRPSREVADSPG